METVSAAEILEEQAGWRRLAAVLHGLAGPGDPSLTPLELARAALRVAGADRAVVAAAVPGGPPELLGAAQLDEGDDAWRGPVAAVLGPGGGPALFLLDEEDGARGRALACPLLVGQRALGALYCDRLPSGGRLGARELELVRLLAIAATPRLELARLRDRLAGARRHREALLAAVADGLLVVNAEGGLEAWNPPAERLLGPGLGATGIGPRPRLAGWPALARLAAVAGDGARAAALLPGGAARVRTVRPRAAASEPGDVILVLEAIGHAAERVVHLAELVATVPAMSRALQAATAAARDGGPVLVSGEAGTGKRLLAQALAGAVSEVPAVIVTCRAAPDGSELLGRPGWPGLVDQAEAGPPLVLAGVDELEPRACARLLEELARRGPRLFVTSRRPIAALARHLQRELRARLAARTIELPPLRERTDELPALVAQLLARAAAARGRAVVPAPTPEVEAALRAHLFPDNVRELATLLEAELDRLPPDGDLLFELPAALASGGADARVTGAGRSLAEAGRQLLVQALQQHQGNVPRVARTLGVSKGTVYNMMRKYHVDPTTFRVSG